MIDAKNLLDRFLGQGGAAGVLRQMAGGSTAARGAEPGRDGNSPWTHPGGTSTGGSGLNLPGGFSGGSLGGLADAARQAMGQSGKGGLAAGGVAGGLLGLLVGGKKKGGLNRALTHGGAALLGALASRAYENWQKGQPPAQAPVATPQEVEGVEERFLPAAKPAPDGQPFELALIRAMIAAAKADGHIDAGEQRRIFAKVEEAGLDAEAKGFVFDALAAPVGIPEVASLAGTPEQAAELYLASRLTVDPDQPAERAYLEALAHRLKLPEGLVAHLDRQAAGVTEGVAAG
ncbi:tellurite resistance TerB family protein [Roseomonas gilardii subsp. gilardii]|uniref:tellurite resistance TerB family protein n=1 Tax=Roseomonas gilardii TaxID=257708 RepID=UPI001FFA1716|nr:tellurite resistance TerB family protein [Roseomonas gilardii]UPG71709.1 tellurite resistance TerB family protein [Roseomonas gilardii subsp. gilardii]